MGTINEIKSILFRRAARAFRNHQKAGLAAVGCIAALVAGILLAIVISGTEKEPGTAQPVSQTMAETVQPDSEDTSVKKKRREKNIPEGFSGIIEGIMAVQAANGNYYALGTNVEDVLVGQRTSKRESAVINGMGSEVAASVNDIDSQSWELVEHTQISDNDYETLLAIVEAEAGGEDLEGRIMVANVILNRVDSELFPDTVTDVVWQSSGGSPQFSPTADGRLQSVTVSDTTREAVNRAIDGEDLSQEALFFLEREYSETKNIEWFDSSLKFLFKHGVHSFYKY